MEPSHEGAPGASATADGESASPTRLRVDTHAQDPAPNGTHGYPRHAGSPVDGLHPAVAALRRYSGSGPAGTPESAAAVTPSAFQSPAPVSSSTLDTVQHVLDLVLHPPADNPLAWVQVADAAQLPDHLMLLLYRCVGCRVRVWLWLWLCTCVCVLPANSHGWMVQHRQLGGAVQADTAGPAVGHTAHCGAAAAKTHNRRRDRSSHQGSPAPAPASLCCAARNAQRRPPSWPSHAAVQCRGRLSMAATAVAAGESRPHAGRCAACTGHRRG